MIGSAVMRYLTNQGYELVRLVRHPPGKAEVRWDPDTGEIDSKGIEGFDGVVHLASMPWPIRWTSEAKNRIRANRLATNRLLAETLSKCEHKPRVLVCASGMGIYPSSGDQVLSEDSEPGSDFLAALQCEGEAVAMKACRAGIRVVNLRIPAVLGEAAIRRNMGRIGNGRQWSSWVARIAGFYAFGAITLLSFLFITPQQATSIIAQRHGLPVSTGNWFMFYARADLMFFGNSIWSLIVIFYLIIVRKRFFRHQIADQMQGKHEPGQL